MKKSWKIGLLVLVVLIVGALLFSSIWGGHAIKGVVNTFGPRIMGVDVSVDNVRFRPFTRRIVLRDLHIGNPEGFSTPALMEVEHIDAEVRVRSLLTDTIIIERAEVRSPHITYERGWLSSNLATLTEQLESPEINGDDAEETGRRVVIRRLLVTEPALRVSITGTGGRAVPVQLGRIELENIGAEDGGVAFNDALRIVFSVLTSNITNVVSSSGELIGDAVGSGVDAVGDGARAVGRGAASAGRSVTDLFRSDDDDDEPDEDLEVAEPEED